MKIRKRTGEEIKAYIDGYNACFKDFENYLKNKDNHLHMALSNVEKIKSAINACIDIKENK